MTGTIHIHVVITEYTFPCHVIDRVNLTKQTQKKKYMIHELRIAPCLVIKVMRRVMHEL